MSRVDTQRAEEQPYEADRVAPGRSPWLAFVPLAGVVGLALWVATAGVVHVVGQPYRNPPLPLIEPDRIDPPSPAPSQQLDPSPVPPTVRVVVLLVIVAVLLGVIAVLVRRWAMRTRRRRGIPPVVVSVVDVVLADAEEQRAALLTGAPRNAIVRCWQRLEAAIEAAGHPAQPWETPTEVTASVLRREAVDESALAELLSLYREARFSNHELGEAQRAAAVAALDRLHLTMGGAQGETA